MVSRFIHPLLMLLYITVIIGINLAAKQKVYYGEADLLLPLLKYDSQWTYVQENADGFYVSNGQLSDNMSPTELAGFFHLFKNKSIYYETDADPQRQTINRDKAEIIIFHTGGWNITHTSQNDGWTVERDEVLGYYNLTEKVPRRPDYVQLGPWTLSGNISNDPGTGHYPNAQYRAWINQSDGVSTDGPMGYWSVDFKQVREGSYSTVQYAHSIGRPAAVMLCPYGAGINTYNSTRDFLSVGISAIQGHEDNDADPDIWIIFEYGDSSIPSIPEQVNGYPANSTTGMAYYALKHRDGEPETLDLYVHEGNIGLYRYVKQSTIPDVTLNPDVPIGTVLKYTLRVADYSPWLDYAACIQTYISSSEQSGWDIQYSINEFDITTAMSSSDGFDFIREHRIQPNSVQSIVVSFTRTLAVHQNMTLTIQLAPHRGSDVIDSFRILL